MIICETQFTRCPPDPQDPDISLHEVDFYSHIPITSATNRNHRLSLRYRLSTKQWEIYMAYYDDSEKRVVWSGDDFTTAIERANQIVKHQWGQSMGNDKVCQHERPGKAHGCREQVDQFIEAEMVYKGIRGEGSGPIHVWKCENGQVDFLDPWESQKLSAHPHARFQWGYYGFGPAQLALAILLDATGDPALSVQWHQSFKVQYVATWGDQWEISRAEVLAWLQSKPVETGA